APNSVFPLLDNSTRMDMIDYFNSGMTNTSTNNLKGQSAVTALSDKTLSVKMTDSSTAQIAVLDAGSGQVIAVISTVAAPGLDSSIAFFDADWSPLPDGNYFAKPSIDDWLTDEGKANKAEVEMQVPFMLASYNYDPATGKLLLINNLNRFLDEDIYEIVSPYLRPTLSYTWNGKKFTLDR
ncbi:MAG: DUF3256 family protein, partial [Duncaniella sp.]|nr:DUF3256 family protein [Duncaniella sp.]